MPRPAVVPRNAADLLGCVEVTLGAFGRPRKLPGQPRAKGKGMKRSLPAHVEFAAKTIRTMGVARTTAWRAQKVAAVSILDAAYNTGHGCFDTLAELDEAVYDTRQIVRIVRKARKALR